MSGEVDPRFHPEFQRGYDPTKHGTSKRSTPRAEERREATRLEAAPDDPRVDDLHPIDAPEPPRTRILIALPIAAVVFLVATIGLIASNVAIYTAMSSSPVGSDIYLLLNISALLLPATIVGTILSAISWLVVIAVVPRRNDA